MSTIKKSIEDVKMTFPPLPKTERGFGIHIDGNLKKKKSMIYCQRSFVIIRSLEDPTDCIVFKGHRNDVNVAKFSPNGEWVASGDSIGTVIVWSTNNMNEKNNTKICKNVLDIDWASDNSQIVVVGDGAEGNFGNVFRLGQTNSIGVITQHSKKVLSVAFNKLNPKMIVTASEDFACNIYTGGPPYKFDKWLRNYSNYVNCVRFSHDDTYFATVSSDKSIIIYTTETLEIKIKMDSKTKGMHKGSIYSCSWSEDDKYLITCSADKTAKIWDMENYECYKTYKFGNDVLDMQTSCIWLNRDYIITVSLSGDINFLNFDYVEGSENGMLKKMYKGHNQKIFTFVVNKSLSKMYTCDFASKIVSWNLKTKEGEYIVGKGHSKKPIHLIALSSDEKTLFSLGYDNKLFATHTKALKYEDNELCKFNSMANLLKTGNSNNELIAISTNDNCLSICSSGKCYCTKLKYEVKDICFNENDTELLVGGSDKKIHIYKVDKTKLSEINTIAKHIDKLSTISFSIDYSLLVSTDASRAIFIWKTGEYENPKNKNGWKYHTSKVNTCSWFNKNAMVTGSNDENIIVWLNAGNCDSKKRITFTNSHPGGVYKVSKFNDNCIVSLGHDRFIRVWDVKSQ